MKQKGQGALEYLLLIGGAVVVAAIVVVLLLGLGSTNQNNADIADKATMCAKISALDGLNNCQVKDSGGASRVYLWESKTGKCWRCTGSFPKCTLHDTVTANPACPIGQKICKTATAADCGAGANKII